MNQKIYWVKEYDLYEDLHDEVEMKYYFAGSKELNEWETTRVEEIAELIEEQRALTKKIAERIPSHWKLEAKHKYMSKIYQIGNEMEKELLEEMRDYCELDEDAYHTAVTEQEDYERGEFGEYIKEINRRY